MESNRKESGSENAKVDPFGRPGSTLANADPFGDLLSFTPNQPSSSNLAGGKSVSRPKPPPPVMTSDGSLAAEKRKSQESRQKRDTFLNQMSSFLEGIESNTTASVVPPESYTAVAFPASAESTPSASIFPESTSSLMKEEDLFGDPFVQKEVPTPTTPKPPDGLRGVMLGSTNSISHPRGSLFDDDVDLEEKEQPEPFLPQPVVTSDSVGSPPRRVTPSPLPLSAPAHDARGLSQGRPKNRTKPTRGLDLEEVRRRTSLLSGESRDPTPTPTTSRQAVAASRPATASSYFDAGWGRQHASPTPSPSEVPHPLHAAAVSDPVGAEGNYFNEEILRAREQGGRAGGRVIEQGPRGGDGLMDSAGSFLTTARDGAKTLLEDAKAGVGAVGASWQGSREETGQQRFGRPVRPSQGFQQKETENEREFDVTFGEGRLGFTIFREDVGSRKGQGVVCKVHTGSTAHTLGVQVGDMVTCVNKHRYDTYDEVMKILPQLPRPVLISFLRPGRMGQFVQGNRAAAVRRSSTPSEGGGGNALEWLARLNPFEKRERDEEDELGGERRISAGSMVPTSQEYGSPGEVYARGLRGGVFSWSYYGTSDGIEANTKDTYTEHVMRIQWGKTADTMTSWMVARRYREFDALDLDLRDAYPDRREALPRLPPKEFFKLARDVVERRTKGLEMYMTTLIRRFPDMLEASHLDRFLTISERLSALQTTSPGSNSQALSYRSLGANGSSSNVFPLSEEPSMDMESSLVRADGVLNLMSSAEAWRLSTTRNSSPVNVAFCEDLVDELSSHISRIPPEAHPLQDDRLCHLVARCQKAWPGLKAAAGRSMSEDACGTLLPRIVQCDENMERAFESVRALLISRG